MWEWNYSCADLQQKNCLVDGPGAELCDFVTYKNICYHKVLTNLLLELVL